MLAKDYKVLTHEQLLVEDEEALTTSKKTLKVLSEAYSIDTKCFPKPDRGSLREFLNHFEGLSKWEPDITLVNTAFGAAAIMQKYNNLTRCFSCLAYFLTTQGLSIKTVKVCWDDFYHEMFTCDDWGKYAYHFNIVPPYKNINITLGSSRKVSTQVSSELPLELVQHLENFLTVEEIILEACRIMMLGPKTKRAESAVGSLVNAWNIMQKTK